ncbi:hypothetical protein [Pseudoalteromonas umbrosa]|uniref:hypothetical protein n=1 Tax=Pseudoalteromonas umbrosa TaxID=3048489 RepID=UPI0024C3E33A|nr:hypothetical protein [Pseudoalteromonas sp. B95]MDK1290237.1 hypothetical protein [Pseudoalteromonas sp. B95]
MLSETNFKNLQLSGWISQLKKQFEQFDHDLASPDIQQLSLEEQLIFIQRQYELLNLMYNVAVGYDDRDVVQQILGVDAELFQNTANTANLAAPKDVN